MQRSVRILFVDDEPNLLAALARKLRRDFEVVTACGAEQGLDVLETEAPFDAVVADMQMPGMDGIDFLKQVRGRCPDSARIMLTGNADQSTLKRAHEEAEIARFLSKPCSPEALRDAILATIASVRAA